MTRFKLLTVMLLASAVLAAFPIASTALSAQVDDDVSDPPVDIELVERELARVDSIALAVELETPPVDADLPVGFVEATFVDPNAELPPGTTRGQQGVLDLEALLGVGIDESVAYTVEGDPAVLGGTVNTSTLSYVIVNPLQFVDDPATEAIEDLMLDLEKGIEDSFNAEQTGGLRLVDVTQVDDDDDETLLAELDGLLATYTLDDGDVSAATQLYIVPVGNVLIFSLVTVGDLEPVNEATLQAPAENLALAGIEHLETAVYALTQPEPAV